jgi:hypothetical protein
MECWILIGVVQQHQQHGQATNRIELGKFSHLWNLASLSGAYPSRRGECCEAARFPLRSMITYSNDPYGAWSRIPQQQRETKVLVKVIIKSG